jgi:hypothetical protein
MLPLSSCAARFLLREDTAQPGTPEAVSPRLRRYPCGAKGSCGVPAMKRAQEPCNALCPGSYLPITHVPSASFPVSPTPAGCIRPHNTP